MKKKLCIIGLCGVVAAFAQSISSPKQVTPSNVFTWVDTNVPPAVRYTVYGQSTKTGSPVITFSTTNRFVPLSSIFGTKPAPGAFSLTVLGWDATGEVSEGTTNYYVRFKMGRMVNLQVN